MRHDIVQATTNSDRLISRSSNQIWSSNIEETATFATYYPILEITDCLLIQFDVLVLLKIWYKRPLC